MSRNTDGGLQNSAASASWQRCIVNLGGEVLRTDGYRVLEAGNSEEALQAATQHSGRIDLLLTDTIMSGISGPVLLQQLKRLRPEIRVLFMSGYTGGAAVLHDVLESGVAFLQKLFHFDALIRKVNELLHDG